MKVRSLEFIVTLCTVVALLNCGVRQFVLDDSSLKVPFTSSKPLGDSSAIFKVMSALQDGVQRSCIVQSIADSNSSRLCLSKEIKVIPFLSEAVNTYTNDERGSTILDPLEGLQVSSTFLSVISVVITALNEHSFLSRTLDSILSSTTLSLLREIIVVDDVSYPPMSSALKDIQFSGLVKFIVNERREGLIRSRIIGAKHVSADSKIIIFLDCHVKPRVKWDYFILEQIVKNYRSVILSASYPLNEHTWKRESNAVGLSMFFNWSLEFFWDYELGDRDFVALMSGGNYAITRRWWFESGTYDDKMEVWGGENIEQSVRMWLCGGSIRVARQSFIGHLYRSVSPHGVKDTTVTYNKARAAAVWFDEFIDIFARTRSMDVRGILNLAGDISERVTVRKTLRCANFSSYLLRFIEDLQRIKIIPVATYLIKARIVNPGPINEYCLTVENLEFIGPRAKHDGFQVVFEKCDPLNFAQRFTFSEYVQKIRHVKSKNCLNAYNVKELRSGSAIRKRTKYDPQSLDYEARISSCSFPSEMALKWQDHRLTFGSLCLDYNGLTLQNPLKLRHCVSRSSTEIPTSLEKNVEYNAVKYAGSNKFPSNTFINDTVFDNLNAYVFNYTSASLVNSTFFNYSYQVFELVYYQQMIVADS